MYRIIIYRISSFFCFVCYLSRFIVFSIYTFAPSPLLSFLSSAFPPPLLPRRPFSSFCPHSAQFDRCLAAWPVIITPVLGVSGGWRWLLFEYFTAKTGQDRTLPGAVGGGRGNEDRSKEDRGNGFFIISWFLQCLLPEFLIHHSNNTVQMHSVSLLERWAAAFWWLMETTAEHLLDKRSLNELWTMFDVFVICMCCIYILLHCPPWPKKN